MKRSLKLTISGIDGEAFIYEIFGKDIVALFDSDVQSCAFEVIDCSGEFSLGFSILTTQVVFCLIISNVVLFQYLPLSRESENRYNAGC